MRQASLHSAGQRAPLSARMVFALLFSLLFWFCVWLLEPVAHVSAAPTGGVPSAVWQDTERNHRRSPSQIKRQLRSPDVRAARMALPQEAHEGRTALVRNLLAANAVPLAEPPVAGEALDLLQEGDWRLKLREAAVVHGEMVLLGDIASPLGKMDAALWQELRTRQLWPAPSEEGKPLQINRSRLSQALRQVLGKQTAGRCILPASLVIQRGGLVFGEDALREYVVKSLTPQMAAMPGQAELTDFRLPSYIFLAHAGQQIQLEPGKLSPGRVPLRFAVQEADGTVLRRVSGTVNLLLWLTVPTAARPLGKGEALSPQAVTFMRVNASQLRDVPWDGQGGPWQTARALTTGEPVLQSDLVSQNMVQRGDVLTLDYVRGNVHISARVEALADGGPGETIPVRNLQSKKQVYATVRDGGTVEIR